jgi:hypothetical protein
VTNCFSFGLKITFPEETGRKSTAYFGWGFNSFKANELGDKNDRLSSCFAFQATQLNTSSLWIGRFSSRSKLIIIKQ